MSRDATAELLAAVRSALIADAAVAGYVATRVSKDWGLVLDAPYIRLSIPTVKQYEDDGGEGSEYTLRVHAFAKESDPVVSMALAARIRDVLRNGKLQVNGTDIRWLGYTGTINIQDGDDPTLRMAVVSFNALTTDSY